MSPHLRAICSNTISIHCREPVYRISSVPVPLACLSHHRLIEPQFLHQGISANWRTLLERLVEVIAHKGTGSARVGTRTEWQEEKWGVEC